MIGVYRFTLRKGQETGKVISRALEIIDLLRNGEPNFTSYRIWLNAVPPPLTVVQNARSFHSLSRQGGK